MFMVNKSIVIDNLIFLLYFFHNFSDKNYHLSTQYDHNQQLIKTRSGTQNIVLNLNILNNKCLKTFNHFC
jgi:hypothetical protein